MSDARAKAAEALAREIGGDRLVRFFDAVLSEQRKRWSAPDWRNHPVADFDLTNWRDVLAALSAEAAAVPADREGLARRLDAELGRTPLGDWTPFAHDVHQAIVALRQPAAEEAMETTAEQRAQLFAFLRGETDGRLIDGRPASFFIAAMQRDFDRRLSPPADGWRPNESLADLQRRYTAIQLEISHRMLGDPRIGVSSMAASPSSEEAPA